MALIQCAECGKSISDKATTCPGCGCPMKIPQPEIGAKECLQNKSLLVKYRLIATIAVLPRQINISM